MSFFFFLSLSFRKEKVNQSLLIRCLRDRLFKDRVFTMTADSRHVPAASPGSSLAVGTKNLPPVAADFL